MRRAMFWSNMKPPHPLPATVAACAEGIKKLRAVHQVTIAKRNEQAGKPVFTKVGDRFTLDETKFVPRKDETSNAPPKECIEIELYFDNNRGSETEGYDVYQCISAPSHPEKETPVKIFVKDPKGELKRDAQGNEVMMKECKEYNFQNLRLPEENKLVLWRGMKDMQFDENFFKNGGADMAFLSTTRDLSIAVQYASGGSSCLVLKLSVPNFLDRGADLTFLSAFPEEVEFLYPPLTTLTLIEKDPRLTKEFKLKDIFFAPPAPNSPSPLELSEEKKAPLAKAVSAPSKLEKAPSAKGSLKGKIFTGEGSADEKGKSQWWYDMGYYQKPHFHRECERVDGKTLLHYLEFGKEVKKPVEAAGEDGRFGGPLEVTEYIKKPEMGGKFETSSEYTKKAAKKVEYVMKKDEHGVLKPFERPKKDANGNTIKRMSEDGENTVKGPDGKALLEMEKVPKLEWPVTKDTWVRMNGDSQWRTLDDLSYVSFFGSEKLRGAIAAGVANKQAYLDLDGDGKVSIEEQQEMDDDEKTFVKVLELEARMAS